MNDANWLLNWYMTPCTPRRIIPLGVATYVEYACVGLSGLGILGFIAYAIKAAADAIAKRRFVPCQGCPAWPGLPPLTRLGSASCSHAKRQPTYSINQSTNQSSTTKTTDDSTSSASSSSSETGAEEPLSLSEDAAVVLRLVCKPTSRPHNILVTLDSLAKARPSVFASPFSQT